MKSQSVVFSGGRVPQKGDYDLSGSSSVLFIVIAATEDRAYVRKVLDALKTLYTGSRIIGASSDEAIVPEGVLQDRAIAVTALSFEDTVVETVRISSCLDAAERVESYMRDDTKLMISFSEASSVNGELLLDALRPLCGSVPVCGGVAATPTFENTFVIEDAQILDSGAVMAFLHSKSLTVYTDFSFGWQAVGRSFKITEAEGNRIVSISGISPAELFGHYLGKEVVDAMPGIGSAFPFMIKRDNMLIARGIIGVDGSSFIVSGNVKVGDEIRIGYGNPYSVMQQNGLHKRLVRKLPDPECILSFYCEGRKLFLPRDVVEYEERVLNVVAPTVGMFTLGEFFGRGRKDLLNFSSTVVALKEGEPGGERALEFPPPPRLESIEMVAEGLFHFIEVRVKELENLAYYDELTGLPNRTLFTGILQNAIANVTKEGGSGALFFIDIDNFKDINDTVGHREGDEILRLLSERLEKELGRKRRLCRFGGDEFAIVAENMGEGPETAKFAEEILQRVKERIEVGVHGYHLTASIGITFFSEQNPDVEEILKQADIAMYRSKRLGKNRWSIYLESMGQDAKERYFLEQQLRGAIEKREFVLHYQPQYDIETGEIVSVEALVRWSHPERGMLFPDSFIEIAETSGLIIPLGELVLDMALEFFTVCRNLERVAVNISSKQFNDSDFFSMVMRLLEKHGINPENLELEMTESVVMDDDSETTKLLFALAEKGIKLSIDDFGTGYSSLSYLKRMPITTLKIDRSFVTDLPEDENDAAIVRSIIAMAKTLGLKLVAEGIETKEQENFFKEEGGIVGQGYYYSRPIPQEEILKRLR
ncbi:diguanylate cyclase/phosphodiesterase (GGDEF & EAL domains) with PAS/PAC sensor [Hydrogenimonas sp.]|nr:diguanylate cyclase/phosphodiesterase (GGDEF & EAL domains) with PAS/PAC sensor [Hydrogenimonas sp.]